MRGAEPRRLVARAAERAAWLLAAAVALGPCAARADEAALLRKVEQLEARLEQLETERDAERAELETRVRELETGAASASPGRASDWTRRIRLSGSANLGYYDGDENSGLDEGSFEVWDARLFVDADLGRDVTLGETRLLRDVGFAFEANVVRLGRLQSDDFQAGLVGEAYVDFQGIADSGWLNLQAGRFQIPVGENYLRFSRGYASNPFVSNTVGGAWWWDEGLRAYGSGLDGKLGYVASVSNGDTDFGGDADAAKQLTLKLWTEPWPWLHLSASALRTGTLGSPGEAADGALWLGETWATPVGSMSPLPTFAHGVRVADGPNELRDTYYFGADAIVRFEDAARLWLSYGTYGLGADGPSRYDRRLHQWVAELVLEGALASSSLRPFYLGLRANGLGTYDRDEGYLLDVRQSRTIGYNARALDVYSLVLGWRISDRLTLKAEYGIVNVELVRGVTRSIESASGANDAFAVELGAQF